MGASTISWQIPHAFVSQHRGQGGGDTRHGFANLLDTGSGALLIVAIQRDPWPIVAQKDVPGAYQVIRGGNHISYVGFNVGMRGWVAKNGDTIRKFLASLSEADQWMRANPKDATQTATRRIPGLNPAVAETAMGYNIQQADRRLSANNCAAVSTLHRLGFIDKIFDTNKHMNAIYIVDVMKKQPNLYADLPKIPADAMIGEGYIFTPKN